MSRFSCRERVCSTRCQRNPRARPSRRDTFAVLDADPDLPDIREDDPRWVRCAVYTRQSVKRSGDAPAVTSCALQRTLCTEFVRNKTWEFWYPIAERFDDEGESGTTLERPGPAKLLRRIEAGDIHRVIVYRVDRLTRKLADLARVVGRMGTPGIEHAVSRVSGADACPSRRRQPAGPRC